MSNNFCISDMRMNGPCVPATTVCGYMCKRHRGERLRRRDAGREKKTANLEISAQEEKVGVALQHRGRRATFSISECWLINKS